MSVAFQTEVDLWSRKTYFENSRLLWNDMPCVPKTNRTQCHVSSHLFTVCLTCPCVRNARVY